MRDLTRLVRRPVTWGRWCLPSFNVHCDQILKGSQADGDNSFCDSLVVAHRQTRRARESEAICPWENPTLVVYADSFGI